MTAAAPPAAPPAISPFTASRDQACTSGADCDGVKAGQDAAYVGWATGAGAVCGPCLTVIRANIAAATGEPEQTPDPLADGPMPADPYLPEGSPAPQTDALAALWFATDGGSGDVDLTHLPEEARRSLAVRGLILLQSGGWQLTAAGRAAFDSYGRDPEPEVDEHGWPAEGSTPELPEGDDPDDPADAAAEPTGDVHECECKRVSKRATFGRTADGRPTHEHCGGLLRRKHMHLLPANQQPDPTENTTEPESEARTDDGDDAAAGEPGGASADTDPGAGAGAGVEARPADGATRAGEAGGEGGERAGEGDHRGDQGGGESPRARGGDHPEPVRGQGVEAGAAGAVDVRLDGVQEGAAGRVGAVGEEVDRLDVRRDGLTGLAAFYAQPDEGDDPAPGAGSPAAPTDSTPVAPRSASAARPRGGEAPEAGGIQPGGLAAFYAQPDDEPVEPGDFCGPEYNPDDDAYDAALDTLDRLYGGRVTALIMDVGAERPCVIEVLPR